MVEYGTLVFLALLLQSLAEVFQGDLGAIGPQMRDQIALSYPNFLIYQIEELVLF